MRYLILPVLLVVAAIAVAALPAKGKPDSYKGRSAEAWHWKYTKLKRAHARQGASFRAYQRRVARGVHGRRDSLYAIRLASATFHVPYYEMMAVAMCETGHTLNPYSKNSSSSAAGLFQFLDSTWASQGITGHSVYDPVANALAAARIASREGWRQWVCKP